MKTTQELIYQTKQLIRIPSVANNSQALRDAVEFVAKMIENVPNITIERFEHNGKLSFLAYRGTKRPDKFTILLNGHVDVMPAKPEQFEAFEKDGRLYGRGALDMKGTTIVMANAFAEMVNKVPYDLALQVVSDEELGGYDCTVHQIEQGVRAEFVIMGEYGNHPHTIYNAARGLCWAEIVFSGKLAHGGHLWHGENAVLMASEFAAKVLQHYPTPSEETWTTTASVSSLETSNKRYNRVPDQAVLKIDFRFTDDDPIFKNRESVEAFVKNIDPNAKLLKLSVFEPAVVVDELNPYVQGMTLALAKASGTTPQFKKRPASSDGRHYALVNVDNVEYGIYGQGSHSDEEYAEISSFAEYYATLRDFLKTPVPKKLKTAEQEPLPRKILRDLVAIPSVSGDHAKNGKVIDYVQRFLEERGMFTRRYEQNGFPSLVATVKPNHKRPSVMLVAHSDVVPALNEQYELQSKDGNYYGRGVFDMKFAIAAYLSMVDALQDNLAAYDFGIVVTSDEEIGGQNGMKMLIAEGFKPKVAIVPDGGDNWRIQTFAKGAAWIKLTASGVSGHVSQPWKTDNAIHKLLPALMEIQALVPSSPTAEDPFKTSLSVGTISGGEVANQAAPTASSIVDIRYGNVEDYERIPKAIEHICATYGVACEFLVNDPPTGDSLDNPYVKKFYDLIVKHTGQVPGPSPHFALTDARFLSMLGVPCVIVSPEGGDCHGDNEWMSQESFEKFCTIVQNYVADVGSQQSQPLSRKAKEILQFAET